MQTLTWSVMFWLTVGVMIGMVHALMPLCVMTMLAVMRNIDSNLPRAAATLPVAPRKSQR